MVEWIEGVLACLLHCPYGLERENMELKAATAGEKLLFIKCYPSMAGDMHHSGELLYKFIKNREKL